MTSTTTKAPAKTQKKRYHVIIEEITGSVEDFSIDYERVGEFHTRLKEDDAKAFGKSLRAIVRQFCASRGKAAEGVRDKRTGRTT